MYYTYQPPNQRTIYYHRCGQPVELREYSTGYQVVDHPYVGDQFAEDCPRCGRRIWVARLLHEMEVA